MKDSERIEQLEYAVAVAYQLAGACGAPKRFLGYFSEVLDEWDDIEDPLPVSCDEFEGEDLKLIYEGLYSKFQEVTSCPELADTLIKFEKNTTREKILEMWDEINKLERYFDNGD